MSENDVDGFCCPYCKGEDLQYKGKSRGTFECMTCGEELEHQELKKVGPYNFTGDYDAVKDYLGQSREESDE